MKSFKKIFVITAVFTVLFAVKAFAAPPEFSINGLRLNVTPVFINSVAYLSLDQTLAAANIKLTFPDANTVIATQPDYGVSARCTMDNGVPTVNGRRVNGTIMNVDSMLFIPVRPLAEAFGARMLEESAGKVAVQYDM